MLTFAQNIDISRICHKLRSIHYFLKGLIMATTSISISANIPVELGAVLDKVSRAEERSKSYYIKKGLEQVLRDRLEDLEDYTEAKQAYDEFVASGEKAVPFENMIKELNL